ncbi:MAG: hypothetical protein ACI4A5_11725 [Hominilimicola sp.]
MRKNKKMNIVSMLLMLAVMVSAMGITVPASAEVTFPLTDKAKLSVKYLGVSENGSGPASAAVNGGVTLEDAGKVIWVGVAVEDSYKLTENFTQSGIYNMEIAFDYNPEYIQPCSDIAGNEGTLNDKTSWLETLKTYNLSSDASGTLDALYWDADNYELVEDSCSMEEAVNIDACRENAPAEGDKMMFISLRSKETSSDYRFKGSLSSDSDKTKYLIRIPFKVIKVPDGGIDNNSLKLALGPQTFVLGSGDEGYSPYAVWEKEDQTTPEVNLKNYFDWTGDIVLFTPPITEKELTDIKVFQYIDPSTVEDPDNPPEAMEYSLFKDMNMTEAQKGFSADCIDYYTAVDHDVGAITLKIFPDIGTDIVIMFNDETAPTAVTSDTGNDCMDTDPMQTLVQVNPDTLDTDNGFNNTVTITTYDKYVYTIHVRRYRKPEIVLNYGNSPAGLIRRDTDNFVTKELQDAAIEAFKISDKINKTYVGQVPKGGNANLKYTPVAWTTYNPQSDTINDKDYMNADDFINYDLDDTALFVYQGKKFKDPGITVYNELGIEVENPTVTRTLKLKKQLYDGVSSYTGNDTTDKVTEIDAPLVSGTTDTYDLNLLVIRTDVYKMEYDVTYTSASGTHNIKDSRPVIILGRRGDIFLSQSPATSDADANYLRKNVTAVQTGHSLVAYRNADFDTKGSYAISDADANYLVKNTTDIQTSEEQYYSDLNPELN